MKIIVYVFVTFLSALMLRAEGKETYLKFAKGFRLGVATSSYQIEGAWNASDKGVNVWDRFTHEKPSPIADGSDGDIACDSYNRYGEDIAWLSDLGADAYRISLSWSRILPDGFSNRISVDGIGYYKNLVDELVSRGIEPFVTLYHFDHPAILEDMGGWTNEMMVEWFVDYARVVFEHLGDKVRIFATLNEPADNCKDAYGTGEKAPGKRIPKVGPYLCMHNKLKAHARVYRIYEDEYRSRYGGKVGIVMQCMSYYPKYPENDTESGEIQYDFSCGWMADPIFLRKGDYPESMKLRIGENSRIEKYPRSRLPSFTDRDIAMIRGSADFLGLNHYTSVLTESVPRTSQLWYRDTGLVTSHDPKWPSTVSSWLKIVPEGFGDLLRKLRDRYDNPTVFVMENGVADDGTDLRDHQRIRYLRDYVKELLLAVNRDNCNVAGYFVWSLLDNFEWQFGYAEHFGLVHVDFSNSTKSRTPKLSYAWYKELLRTRSLPDIFPKIHHEN